MTSIKNILINVIAILSLTNIAIAHHIPSIKNLKDIVTIASILPENQIQDQNNWTPYLDSVVCATETKYHLPHGIYRAFNLKENSGRIGNKALPRVESGFFNVGERHYKQVYNSTIKFFNDNPEMKDSITFDVERFQESTSWGSVQLLGVNLRALGCKKKFLSDLTNEEHIELWAKFFSGYLKQYKTLSKAISMYNGPKAPKSYAADVLKYLKKFSNKCK